MLRRSRCALIFFFYLNTYVLLYVQVQYVCKVIRVRINRVRLPNLLVPVAPVAQRYLVTL